MKTLNTDANAENIANLLGIVLDNGTTQDLLDELARLAMIYEVASALRSAMFAYAKNEADWLEKWIKENRTTCPLT